MPGWVSAAIKLGDITLETAIAAAALVGTLALWLIDRYRARLRRLAYRVQVDAELAVQPKTQTKMVDLEVRHKNTPVTNPSVVLIRVDNVGGDHIERQHIEREVRFSFPDRKIVGLEVTEADPDELGNEIRDRLVPDDFIDTHEVKLPRIAINKGSTFKLLVLLSGPRNGVGSGGLIAGAKGNGVFREPRPLGLSRGTLMFGSVSLLLVGALVAFVLVNVARPPEDCVEGRLRIVGSTAVEPVMKEIRRGYVGTCTDAGIDVTARGSRSGTRALAAGQGRDSDGSALIAMSDGPADDEANLQRIPVAAVVFALVVNRSAGVDSLTTAQVRDIYAGRVTNWSQLGGRSEPIRMVSRVGPDSGSRRVFRDKVLGGSQELGISSDNCRTKTAAASHYRCEVATTDELLSRVDDLEGAIGYAELGTSRKHTGLSVVPLDGVAPDPAKIAAGGYGFWEIEYAYTYQRPEQGSLSQAFLDYLLSADARPVLSGDGLVPCADLAAVCR